MVRATTGSTAYNSASNLFENFSILATTHDGVDLLGMPNGGNTGGVITLNTFRKFFIWERQNGVNIVYSSDNNYFDDFHIENNVTSNQIGFYFNSGDPFGVGPCPTCVAENRVHNLVCEINASGSVCLNFWNTQNNLVDQVDSYAPLAYYFHSPYATTTSVTNIIGTEFGSSYIQQARTVGPAVASATTITPTDSVFHVTGTTTISTITTVSGGHGGDYYCVTLIPDGLWVTNTSGNIYIASTAVVGKPLQECWDGTTNSWHPSY